MAYSASCEFEDLTKKTTSPSWIKTEQQQQTDDAYIPPLQAVTFPCTAKKTPAVQGWQRYKGLVKSPIYGIVIPEGLVVIDLDLYKNDQLLEQVSALLGEQDWYLSELQTTMHGGKHYLFRYDATRYTLRQGSDLFGITGFDTRTAGKGYIASGEGYDPTNAHLDDAIGVINSHLNDPEGTALPWLTDKACELLCTTADYSAPNATAETTAANDSAADSADIDLLSQVVEDSERVLGFSPAQVSEILGYLPNSVRDNRDDWLKVAAGVYRELGDEGWTVFDSWSKGSDSYDKAANLKTFKSFAVTPGAKVVTFKSVLAMLSPTVRNMYCRELNKMTPKNSFLNDYVFITSENEYCHIPTGITMCSQAFDIKHTRDTPEKPDGKQMKASQFALKRITYVDATTYAPHKPAIFIDSNNKNIKYLNTYRAAPREIVDISESKHVARFVRHIDFLLADKTERDLLLQFLAHTVQHPAKRIQWCILLQGTYGDGKSYFHSVMNTVLGDANTKVVNGSTLESNFTGWADGAVITFIEELKIDGKEKYAVINRIKPFITNDVIEITKKGKDPITKRNTANYIAFTNNRDAIPIDESDRRYCIMFSRFQSKQDLLSYFGSAEAMECYYNELYSFLADDAAANELYTYLKTYPITAEFKMTTRAPMTAAKMEMMHASRNEGEIAVLEALELYADQIQLPDGAINVTKMVGMHEDARAFGNTDLQMPVNKALKSVMISLGYELLGRRTVAGAKITAYKKK